MGVYEMLPLSINHPSFRLLELDLNSDAASVDEAAVHAAMDTYDCRNAPEYEALSSTWGTQDGSANMTLIDQWFPVKRSSRVELGGRGCCCSWPIDSGRHCGPETHYLRSRFCLLIPFDEDMLHRTRINTRARDPLAQLITCVQEYDLW